MYVCVDKRYEHGNGSMGESGEVAGVGLQSIEHGKVSDEMRSLSISWFVADGICALLQLPTSALGTKCPVLKFYGAHISLQRIQVPCINT